ncbi:MAG TPA: rhodanese-like domain-containing protein [Pseudomonas sp.]|jgi:rhodanese-related sulfurtransferase|nr:rhodanese-like domain-containing protein [Pseudomonas sp.]
MLAQLIEFVANHYVLSTLLVVLLILFAFNELNKGGRSLNNHELTSLVNSDQGLVLDIRAKKDFDAGHIVGALHMPYEKVATRMVELEKHKDKTIIVVCAHGQTAGPACAQLKHAGYTVAKLSGGMGSWRGDNLPVVK